MNEDRNDDFYENLALICMTSSDKDVKTRRLVGFIEDVIAPDLESDYTLDDMKTILKTKIRIEL